MSTGLDAVSVEVVTRPGKPSQRMLNRVSSLKGFSTPPQAAKRRLSFADEHGKDLINVTFSDKLHYSTAVVEKKPVPCCTVC